MKQAPYQAFAKRQIVNDKKPKCAEELTQDVDVSQ
jgi:hypothetical protein